MIEMHLQSVQILALNQIFSFISQSLTSFQRCKQAPPHCFTCKNTHARDVSVLELPKNNLYYLQHLIIVL